MYSYDGKMMHDTAPAAPLCRCPPSTPSVVADDGGRCWWWPAKAPASGGGGVGGLIYVLDCATEP